LRLHTALERLRADGVIAVDREEIVDSRLRRYYRLTPSGGIVWRYDRTRLLELDLNLKGEQALAECQRRGLVVAGRRDEFAVTGRS
jgi:DNA-binding PadR family transcriptional regulator